MGCIDNMPAGVKFSIISRAFRYEIDGLIKDYGLTAAQSSVLRELSRFEREGHKEVMQKELEERLHLGHPAVTETIKKLEAGGFVVCRKCDSDKRAKLITRTEKAIGVSDGIARIDADVYKHLTEGIPERDLERFDSILGKILTNAFKCREEV